MPRHAGIRVVRPKQTSLKTIQPKAADQETDQNLELLKDQATPLLHADGPAFRNPTPKQVLSLQRTIGNHAVNRMLSQAPRGVMQRDLPELTGAAGFQLIGTSTYGKIKQAVVAYNQMASDTKAQIQLALAKLTLIDGLIDTWTRGHLAKTTASESEKGVELETLTAQVGRERTLLNDKHRLILDREQEARDLAELETAAAAAGYSPVYAGRDFTVGEGLGIKWLSTPAIAPVYRVHLINQHDKPTLDAYDEIGKFTGGRDAAIAIINKYKLLTADVLNLSGEGAGGQPARIAFQAKARTLIATPTAPAPADFFDFIMKSVVYVLDEMFVTFRGTPSYNRITQAPVVRAT